MQLAAQGATVIVHGRDAARGAAVVAEIENNGGSARFVGAELSQPAEALRLAEEVGEVDILVNNASCPGGAVGRAAADALDELLAVRRASPLPAGVGAGPENGGPQQRRDHQRGQQRRHPQDGPTVPPTARPRPH